MNILGLTFWVGFGSRRDGLKPRPKFAGANFGSLGKLACPLSIARMVLISNIQSPFDAVFFVSSGLLVVLIGLFQRRSMSLAAASGGQGCAPCTAQGDLSP